VNDILLPKALAPLPLEPLFLNPAGFVATDLPPSISSKAVPLETPLPGEPLSLNPLGAVGTDLLLSVFLSLFLLLIIAAPTSKPPPIAAPLPTKLLDLLSVGLLGFGLLGLLGFGLLGLLSFGLLGLLSFGLLGLPSFLLALSFFLEGPPLPPLPSIAFFFGVMFFVLKSFALSSCFLLLDSLNYFINSLNFLDCPNFFNASLPALVLLTAARPNLLIFSINAI